MWSSWRTRSASRCGPGVTVIRARVRSRWALPVRSWLPVFGTKIALTFEQFLHVIDGKTTGALRASIGLATTFADVYKFMRFAEMFVDHYLA